MQIHLQSVSSEDKIVADITLTYNLVINPARKLQWFLDNQPDDAAEARELFREYVSMIQLFCPCQHSRCNHIALKLSCQCQPSDSKVKTTFV